jgi:hypothetical protein
MKERQESVEPNKNPIITITKTRAELGVRGTSSLPASKVVADEQVYRGWGVKTRNGEEEAHQY